MTGGRHVDRIETLVDIGLFLVGVLIGPFVDYRYRFRPDEVARREAEIAAIEANMRQAADVAANMNRIL